MTERKDWDNAFTGKSLKGSVQGPNSYGGALSFLRCKYSRDLEGVDVAVTGIPLDTATTNRPGARFGPRAIRAVSPGISWARPWPWEIDPLEELAIIDYGDCDFDHGKPEGITGEIERHIDHILESGTATLVLGGDHYVTYPVLKSYARHYGQLSLIHFDAHSDTWPDEKCKRIDHGTMFYHAAKEGLVDDKKIGANRPQDDQ